ncbi:MAG: alpha/beta hydrolase [Myxococcota bacterium]
MITLPAHDGTEIRALDEGQGPVVLVLHPGLDDGSMWAPVAARLAPKFRVVRLHRRQYRLDIAPAASIAQEVEDVLALVRHVGSPVLLVGHSSGGVVALEALVADPTAFAGAVIYEAPIVIGPLLGGEAYVRARAAIDAGRPGAAMRIFLADVVRVPRWLAVVAGFFIGVIPRLRALAPRQVDDLGAIDQLGLRLDAYAAVHVPTVLLGGDRSPPHLAERLDALARVMPNAQRLVLAGLGHDAQRRAPDEVVRVIMGLAGRTMGRG